MIGVAKRLYGGCAAYRDRWKEEGGNVLAAGRYEHGGQVAKAAAELGVSRGRIVDFSANLNPLGPPPKVIDALSAAVLDVSHYPEPESGTLKRELEVYHALPPGTVVVGNGASELIYAVARALRPRTALVADPTFSEYERAVVSTGGEVISIPAWREDGSGLRRFFMDFDAVLNAINSHKCDLIFVCNPNNPTGTLIPPHFLEDLVGAARSVGAYLCIDESFLPFCSAGGEALLSKGDGGPAEISEEEKLSGVSRALSPGWRHAIILRSFTKVFAIPGARLGYLVASPDVAKRVAAVREPWAVNCFALAAGLQCLKEHDYLLKTRRAVALARRDLVQRLEAVDASLGGDVLRPFSSEANFILCRLGDRCRCDAGSLASAMAKKGILIRDCSNFPYLGSRYIRLAVRMPEENAVLARALLEFFGDRAG